MRTGGFPYYFLFFYSRYGLFILGEQERGDKRRQRHGQNHADAAGDAADDLRGHIGRADALAWGKAKGLLTDSNLEKPVTRAELVRVLYKLKGE